MEWNVYVRFSNLYVFTFIYLCLFYLYVYIYLYAVCDSHFVVLSISVMFPMLYVSFELFSALTCHLTLQLLIFRKFTETLWYNTRRIH